MTDERPWTDAECPNCGRVVSIEGCPFCLLDDGPEDDDERAPASTVPCPWSDCWCKLWPPVRRIFSTGQDYTVEEVEPGLYRYKYLPAQEST